MRGAPRLLVVLFSLAVVLGSLVPGAAARRAPTAVEADVLQRINAVRASAGRAPIAADARLASLAGKHSTRLARAGTLVHAPYARILKAVGARRAGEVIAIGATPAELMGGWMGSGVHRTILLDRRFSMAGVGVAAGQLGGAFVWYVTVDFAG